MERRRRPCLRHKYDTSTPLGAREQGASSSSRRDFYGDVSGLCGEHLRLHLRFPVTTSLVCLPLLHRHRMVAFSSEHLLRLLHFLLLPARAAASGGRLCPSNDPSQSCRTMSSFFQDIQCKCEALDELAALWATDSGRVACVARTASSCGTLTCLMTVEWSKRNRKKRSKKTGCKLNFYVD